MNLDHDFVQVWKFNEVKKNGNGTLFSPNPGEDQKEEVFIKNRTLFSPIFAQMPTHSNYWGGYSQIIGGIYPPIPPSLGTPVYALTLQ